MSVTLDNPTILVEGLDLAGKSTLISKLHAQLEILGWKVRYSRNALVSDNSVARVADQVRKRPGVNLDETALLFLAAHLYDAALYTKPSSGMVHLQDSSWLRTLAFNRSRNYGTYMPLILDAAGMQPDFDVVLYLTASVDARKKRVFQREQEQPGENDSADYLSHTDPELLQKNDGELLFCTKQRFPHTTIIDTSNMSPEEVFVVARAVLIDRGVRI